jgi:hydrogenase/urease accessory protein HupE
MDPSGEREPVNRSILPAMRASSRSQRPPIRPLLLLLAVLLPGVAEAHRLAPSLLALEERATGGPLDVLWKTPLQRPAGVELVPELPDDCRIEGASRPGVDGSAATLRFQLACPGGPVGRRFGVGGLGPSRTEAVVRVALADGRRFQTVLRGDDPPFLVPERQRPLDVLGAYLGLGFRHILEGLDHLLFVLGLVLLVTPLRRLVWTVTAFTVGHSVTLSLAALGFVGLPQGPVEVAIAFSILVLAVEIAGQDPERPTRLARFPWLVAGLFGLLHGLGFAGALREVGLPQEEIPLALFAFNVGIELGQLAFVVVVLAVLAATRPWRSAAPAWLARAPAYGIGSLAAYWCIARTAGLL